MRLLWGVDHALQLLSKRMEARLGVTGPQRLVLRLLGRFPNSTAGFLATILKTHPSTLTGVFHRLEERGLICRTVDAEDRRRTRISLTREGEALNAQRSGTVEAAIRRALGRISEEDYAATERVLLTVVEELERDID
ncbi:MAG: MarR family transcriptional regulator [Myxococcales bacterium]|nr:MarR family transcriptional regulator [Myxococcales bacterium]